MFDVYLITLLMVSPIIILVIIIVHLQKIGLYCPRCRKYFAGRIIGKEVIQPHDGYSWVDGYYLHCKYCGHKWKRVVKYLEPWDG